MSSRRLNCHLSRKCLLTGKFNHDRLFTSGRGGGHDILYQYHTHPWGIPPSGAGLYLPVQVPRYYTSPQAAAALRDRQYWMDRIFYRYEYSTGLNNPWNWIFQDISTECKSKWILPIIIFTRQYEKEMEYISIRIFISIHGWRLTGTYAMHSLTNYW